MIEISVRQSDHVIVQFGTSIGEQDGCIIETVDDAMLEQLHQDGVKHLQADGTITVTPPAPDLAAHAALMEQRANDAKDHALILGKAKTDPVFAALARQLGIPMEG